MKNTKRLIIALMTLVITTFIACGSSFGWLNKLALTVDAKIQQATVIRQYFHCGDGSAENPYVITRPIHYYHLVELFQRRTNVVSKKYFQLGYDLDNDGALEVFAYDDMGNVIMEGTEASTSNALNMAYYSEDYALLPIGTSKVPFDGTFNGSGLTIENLNIRAHESIQDVGEYGTADIGIFGYLSPTSEVKNTYFNYVNIDLTDADSTDMADDHNARAHAKNTVNVGYLAGHVSVSSKVTKVRLNNCTINGAESAINGETANNDFGYFGYVENIDGTSVETLGDSIGVQFGDNGYDPGWGSTLDMKTMYNRLYKIARSVDNTTPTYPTKEVVIRDADTNKIISREVTEEGTAEQTSSREYHHYGSLEAGSYYFNTANGYNPWIYLTGRNEYQEVDITTTEASLGGVTAFFICDDDAKNYLGASNDKEVLNVTKNDAARWMFEKQTGDSQYCICTYLGVTIESDNTVSGKKYYLNKSGNGLSLDVNPLTVWTSTTDANGDQQIYVVENGTYYFITYDSVWQLSTTASTYSIDDGNGHYIAIRNGALSSVTTEGSAAEWVMAYSSNTVAFSTIVDNSVKYLAFSSGTGLTLSNSAFYWTTETTDNKTSYTWTTGGNTWYLAYDNGWKAVLISGNTICCTVSGESHYLTADREKTAIESGSENAYSSLWSMNTSSGSTTIVMKYNGKSYYLEANISNLSLALSTDATTRNSITWNKEETESGIYYYISYSGIKYYLMYDSSTLKWCIKPNQKYLIYYKDASKVNHYMSVATSADAKPTVGQVTVLNNEYTDWNIEDQSGDSVMFAQIDGQNYYLCNKDKKLVLQTNLEQTTDDQGNVVPAATVWKIDQKGRRYIVLSDSNYYIGYDATDGWILTRIWSTYCSNTKYLTLNNTHNGLIGVDTCESNINTQWQIEDDMIFRVVDGVAYYVYANGENNEPIVSTEQLVLSKNATDAQKTEYESKVWKIDGNNIKTKNGKYTLVYESGKWIIVRSGLITISDGNASTPHYLCVEGSGESAYLTTTTTNGTNAHWFKDDANRIGIVHNDWTYYLTSEGATGVLSLAFTSSAALQFTSTTGDPYYRFYPYGLATPFYLVYDNGFKARDTSWHYIEQKDSNNVSHYLSFVDNNGSISFTDSLTKTENARFHCTSRSASKTDIYFYSGGKAYFLNCSGTSLTSTIVTGQISVQWNHDNPSNSSPNYWLANNFYLMYDESINNWRCYPKGDTADISYGTHHLDSSTTAVSDSSNTVDWMYSGSCNGSGTIFRLINGEIYYLCNTNNTLSVSKTTKTTWVYSSYLSTYYVQGTDYYLTYVDQSWVDGSGWQIVPLRYLMHYKFGDYDTYLTANDGGSALRAALKTSEAMQWKFTNVGKYPSGTITTSGGKYLTIKTFGTYWLAVDESSDFSMDWSNNNGIISGSRNRRTGEILVREKTKGVWYNWNVDGSGYKIDCIPTINQLVISLTRNASNTTAKISDPESETNWKNKAVVLNSAPTNNQVLTGMSTCNEAKYDLSKISVNALSVTSKTISPKPSLNLTTLKKYKYVRTVETKAQVFSSATTTTSYGGYSTYIPLRLQLQDDTDETSYYDDYRVDSRNTGYIVSGAYEEGSRYRADIRVSNYDTSDIYRAINANSAPTYTSTYDSRLQVITKTAYSSNNNLGNNGYVRIEDEHNKSNIGSYNSSLPSQAVNYKTLGLEKYEDTTASNAGTVVDVPQARSKLGDMLMGSNDVYGLHFMESQISKDHIIYADQVTILGNTYQNYELPEDAIDFKVKDRGAIAFFAGSYYSSKVTSFFSLHHISRDTYQHITAIKEIKKIYKKGTKPYIYVYGDNSTSDAEYTTEAKVQSEGYSLIFNLEWITNPTMIQNAVYYFEIPVNRGEYALGSVPGGIGAYLLYLDIAIRGGDNIDSRVSNEGSGISDLFQVDYRPCNFLDTTNAYKSLMQFEINAPLNTGTDSSGEKNYYVTTEFDEENLRYILTIKNMTGKDLYLTMFVVDNDDISTNDYPYSYSVKYINYDHSDEIYMSVNHEKVFDTCQEYVIPYKGIATTKDFE